MLIFGHRGSPRRFPENTIASFEEALRAGADGFETDLRLLADGAAVLFHDQQVGEAHAAGLKVIAWTPNRPREWQRLRDIGCDGIITDLPAEAVQWRNSL